MKGFAGGKACYLSLGIIRGPAQSLDEELVLVANALFLVPPFKLRENEKFHTNEERKPRTTAWRA